MSGFFERLSFLMVSFPIVWAQSKQGELGFKVFEETEVAPTFLYLSILLGLMLILCLIVHAIFQYLRRKKYKE